MPRIRYINDPEQTPETRAMITSAERTGAPDPRVVSIMVRSPKAGQAWVRYWTALLYEGVLPHRLKEMCRIRISVGHRCGYCSTVRSNVAREQGLSEELVREIFDYAGSERLTDREKAALRYADLFRSGDDAIDDDRVYAELKRHFTDEEIIELGLLCAETVGAGRLVRSFAVMSWQEACEINPSLARAAEEVGHSVA
jgi:AhpD family alkylhydroperoxidase